MIDLVRFVQSISESTRSRNMIVSGSCEMPAMICADLYAQGAIQGYTAEDAEKRHEAEAIAGWWTDRCRSSWHLEAGRAEEIAFYGHELQINARMLLSAWRAGYKRLYVAGTDVSSVKEIDIARVLAPRLCKAAIRRVVSLCPVTRTMRHLGVSTLTYEEAFRDLIEGVGDGLRMSPEKVIPNRAVMLLGSLGPGGAERQAVATAVGLTKRGNWQPVLACSFVDGGVNGFHRGTAEAGGVPVVQVPSPSPRMEDDVVKKALRRAERFQHLGFQNLAYVILNYACFLSDQRPALVHTWMDYCNVLGGIAAHLAGAPSIVLSGRSVAPDNFSLFQPYMKPGYLCLLQHKPDTAFTNNSVAGATDYARWLGLPFAAFNVIHNGFTFPATSPQEEARRMRSQLGIPDGAPVLGAIIRFSEEKRPHLWVRAAAEVMKRVPQARCVAFGTGVMHEEISRFVDQLGLADRVLLPGLVHDAWAALACMDVFMLTSRMEGLPNVLIEAQSMGVPVVTTGQGGMPETYEEAVTGWTADRVTPESLADAVVPLLLDHSLKQRASKAAMEFARRHFDASVMVEKVSHLFDEVSGRIPAVTCTD